MTAEALAIIRGIVAGNRTALRGQINRLAQEAVALTLYGNPIYHLSTAEKIEIDREICALLCAVAKREAAA
jgi:hypothetical protein